MRIPLELKITGEYTVIVEEGDNIQPYVKRLFDPNDHLIVVTKSSIYISQPSSPRKWLWIEHQGSNETKGPKWNYTIKDGKITISPSIMTSNGSYQEHYFIRDSKVVWLNDCWIEEEHLHYHLTGKIEKGD